MKKTVSTNYADNAEIYVECIDTAKSGKINIPEASQIRLLFLQKGVCSFSCTSNNSVLLESNSVILIPPYNSCIINTAGKIQLIIFGMVVDYNLCNNIPFEKLMEIENKIDEYQQDEFAVLKVNKIIFSFLDHIKYCLSEGLNDTEFFKMKQKELLCYFGEFYSKEEFYQFFKPIFTKDIAFSKAIFEISEKSLTIREMAKEMNYRLPVFKKKFKEIFGLPVYKWLCQKKSEKLLRAITCSRKTFTQLSRDFKFSSPAHMCNFCSKTFGDTPKNLRIKKNMLNLN
jgi:AraC-like DNA-binding protein